MKNIITIQGPVAAGKSTITRILRTKLNTYSYVDRPFIKRGLRPAGKQLSLKLSKRTSYFLIKELVKVEQDIIVEEVNPESMKKNMGETFFKEHNYKIISFFISCSVETAIKRDSLREAKTLGEEGVQRIHKKYVQPAGYEIVINTENASVEECVSKMLSRIN